MVRHFVFALAAAAAFACGDRPEDDASSLIAHWTFDEAGDVAGDRSAYGNAAEIRNGRRARGKLGNALEVTGTAAPDAIDDGIVTIPLSDSLRSTADAITVSAWTYRTAEHNVAVLAHEYPALFLGFHGPGFKWQFQGEPSTSILARLARAIGISSIQGQVVQGRRGVTCYRELERKAELEEWIHLAATFDGRRSRLYVNGESICDRTFWGAIRMPDGPFTISGYLDAEGRIFDEMSGLIDDVRIYDRALDETEIRALYDSADG